MEMIVYDMNKEKPSKNCGRVTFAVANPIVASTVIIKKRNIVMSNVIQIDRC